jgi:hypothetical protein
MSEWEGVSSSSKGDSEADTLLTGLPSQFLTETGVLGKPCLSPSPSELVDAGNVT